MKNQNRSSVPSILMKTETIAYGGWDNCLRLSNGTVDAVIPLEIGPRIIRCGFVGGPNLLGEIETDLGETGGEEWRMYGGHRLWHSPEDKIRTYQPDNRPIRWREEERRVTVTQLVEELTGIEKELTVGMGEEGRRIKVLHRLTNRGTDSLQLAAWAITVMAPGGLEVIPQPDRDTGLLPNRTITLWPYSRMDDPRVRWGNRFITLRQVSGLPGPFKFGLPGEAGWAAYFNRDALFIKKFDHKAGAEYPDFGCSYETYTNDFMLEMETLSPLQTLLPGETVEHREVWELYRDLSVPSGEDKIAAIISPLMGKK